MKHFIFPQLDIAGIQSSQCSWGRLRIHHIANQDKDATQGDKMKRFEPLLFFNSTQPWNQNKNVFFLNIHQCTYINFFLCYLQTTHRSSETGSNLSNTSFSVSTEWVYLKSLALAVFLSCDHMPHSPCWTCLRITITNPTCHSKSACITITRQEQTLSSLENHFHSFLFLDHFKGF